ncbi:uncharacterized protein [Pyrus communis]|uniref:uncharacterized protein n=1 Tax=Pyrus communis TaxID=23211 RepID=UPI0035C2026D
MAGSSSRGEIRTLIFSGVNYDLWRTKLRTIFVSHDLLSLIEDGYVVPLNTVVLTESQIRELKENIKRDAKALGLWSIIEETKDLSTLSVEELIGSLKGFAQRLSRHDNNDVENAFQTLTGKVKYHKCSRFRHMQKDCTNKDNQLAHYTETEGEETNMFYVGHDTTIQEEAKVWFVDNGCSNHMTVNKNILHNIDTTNPTRVKIGNGQLVDTLGKGTIFVHTKNGKMFINDVMLVPDLKQNLLSLGQLIEHGYYLYFGDNTCKIYDGRNREQLLAKIEMRKSRSFPLTIE